MIEPSLKKKRGNDMPRTYFSSKTKEILNDILEYPLTVIEAGSGYYKKSINNMRHPSGCFFVPEGGEGSG